MRIIFIGGSQRSGTTLVQTLIANSLPNAPILPESHIVCDLLRAFKRSKTEWPKTSRIYETVDGAARFFRSAVELHVDDIRSRHGDIEYLVLKDPNFLDVLSELAEVLPEATRIICVRDPRDIVASYLRIGWRQAVLQQRTRYSRREIRSMCKKINAAYQPLLDGSAPRSHLVRYEEIAANTAETLRRLASETGLPLSAEKASELVWLEDEYRHQEAWRTPLEGGPPTDESVGSYRSELSLMERVQVEILCRSLIDRFGYRATSDVQPRKTTIFERAKQALLLVRNRTSN
jgi:protein-tyrosine sulfotransferase